MFQAEKKCCPAGFIIKATHKKKHSLSENKFQFLKTTKNCPGRQRWNSPFVGSLKRTSSEVCRPVHASTVVTNNACSALVTHKQLAQSAAGNWCLCVRPTSDERRATSSTNRPQTGLRENESLGRTLPLFRITCWSCRIFFSCSCSSLRRASSRRLRSSTIANLSSANFRWASSSFLLFSSKVRSSSWRRFLSSSYKTTKVTAGNRNGES